MFQLLTSAFSGNTQLRGCYA